MTHSIEVIDSHTGGEPTRVVVSGAPSLGNGPLEQRLQQLRTEFDSFRTATITEPRGSEVLVGALLCEPTDARCTAGVIFFNNVGYLGMCGHGMIGVIETLKHRGVIDSGRCQLETPVGIVTAEMHENGDVTISNVESFRTESEVKVDADGVGTVVGDVAWGGNWFFLAREPRQLLSYKRIPELMEIATSIRETVNAAGFTKVDHVELFGEAQHPDADSRNFVLCPGLQYDRSPCGTGTSAKLACLAADGKLLPGEPWVQEGILGTSFMGQFQWADVDEGRIRPTIRGRAHITGESRLLLHSDDPFCWGIRGGHS